ncbi:hypothetical protein LPTSP2_38810 [Leptospira ellinghausenii]|uniref:Uncharacterized protein n=1 Tax=Leptospira ellinghausenii TaxID=1917822 RepID=A0A2P2DIW6_9LEPT|nr:hypothetical protein [Leptospira ellinghausenii]GBF44578.1 hypothetical protein LPTSP2_38810 [Leptospira ellinghausenii]
MLKNIESSQEEYLNCIIKLKNRVDSGDINFKIISRFIEEVNCFWLERIEIIELELEELASQSSCFLLSGAIYLGISEYEKYYFKSMGDYHLLYDPFLKLESFFTLDENQADRERFIDFFKRAYYDSVNLLTENMGRFFILPIRIIAIKKEDERMALQQKAFSDIVSGLFEFSYVFSSIEEFSKQFSSYEEIENKMKINVKNLIIFNPEDEPGDSLRKKVSVYTANQMGFSEIVRGMSEAEVFIFCLSALVMQILDILLICVFLNVSPYIRFGTTFHYLMIIMESFSDSEYMKSLIENAILFFIFTRCIKSSQFDFIVFGEYCERISGKRSLDNIMNKIKEKGINIFEGNTQEIELIIKDEFQPILLNH